MQSTFIPLVLAASLSLCAQPRKPAAPAKQALPVDRASVKQFIKDGDAARAQNRLDEAEALYLRAIHTLEPRNVQPETVTALIDLTDLYVQENRRPESIDAAITAMQTGRSCAERTQECVKPTILSIIKTARLFLEVQDYRNAEVLAKQGLDMGHDGALPPDVHLIAMQTYQRVLQDNSQPATASVWQSQIKQMYAEGRFGPKPKAGGEPPALSALFPSGAPHPAPVFSKPEERAAYFDSRIRFSIFDPQFGLNARAEANLRDAIAIGETEKTVPPIQVAGAYRGLSMMLFEARKRDESIAVARKMVDYIEKNLPPEGLELSQAYLDLGIQLVNERQREEALARFELAIAAAKRCTVRFDCDKLEAQASAVKGMILLGDGETEKAEVLIRPLVESGRDKLPPELFQRMIRDYADALRSLNRIADAQAVESKGH